MSRTGIAILGLALIVTGIAAAELNAGDWWLGLTTLAAALWIVTRRRAATPRT